MNVNIQRLTDELKHVEQSDHSLSRKHCPSTSLVGWNTESPTWDEQIMQTALANQWRSYAFRRPGPTITLAAHNTSHKRKKGHNH
jgi:hypothetical protein